MRSFISSDSDDRRAVAILAAACLLLAAIDYLIPKPVPFIRLGLANLPILIALKLFGIRQIASIAVLKIVGQGLITGMLFSYVFLLSAAGTISSVVVMVLIYKSLSPSISLLGVSVAGALASNLAQLVLASAVVFGPGVWVLAAPFLVTGTITSIVLGLLANQFISRSRFVVLVSDRRTPMPNES